MVLGGGGSKIGSISSCSDLSSSSTDIKSQDDDNDDLGVQHIPAATLQTNVHIVLL
jgi:hypothetical protein